MTNMLQPITFSNHKCRTMAGSFLLQVLIMLVVGALLSSCAYHNYRALNKEITGTGSITNEAIPEASGLAVSHLEKDVLWVLNDGGNNPEVFAIDPRGNSLGSFFVTGVKNSDWEDLASFVYAGESYLLIADVGNNRGENKESSLHIVKEPSLVQLSENPGLGIKPERTITFSYPDGPRDCEAVAVDVVHEKILLLSKRDRPPILYELPLWSSGKMVATKLGRILPFPEPSQYFISPPSFFDYTTMPTAMDISANGRSAVVLTYANAYLYELAQSTDNWLTAFSSRPKEILLPSLRQAESICFDNDQNNIFITSEKLPAPLIKINLAKGLELNK